MAFNDDRSNESQIPYYDSLEYQIKLARQSARKLRVYCMTLALALALAFGLTFVSIMIAVGAMQKANRLEYRQDSMDEDVSSVLDLREELREANQKVLQEVWQSVPDVLHKVETDINTRLADFKNEVDSTVERLQSKSDSEFRDFSRRLQTELDGLDLDTKKVQAIFRKMSESYIAVEGNNESLLNPREHLILTLLAREMNPRDPELNLRAAQNAFNFGDYARAQEFATFAVELDAASPSVIDAAQRIRANAKESSKPKKIRHESPGRTRVGPYGIFELHYNTLNALVKNGYLTVDEAQEILERSKHSILAQP